MQNQESYTTMVDYDSTSGGAFAAVHNTSIECIVAMRPTYAVKYYTLGSHTCHSCHTNLASFPDAIAI